MTIGVTKDKKLKLRDLHLVYNGLREGLEHLKIKMRLINERFGSVMGVCVI